MNTNLCLTIILNFGKLVSKVLQATLQVWCFCICIQADFSHKQICFVPKSGSFTHIGSEQLAQLSEVLLHVGDVVMNLPRLTVSEYMTSVLAMLASIL